MTKQDPVSCTMRTIILLQAGKPVKIVDTRDGAGIALSAARNLLN